MEYGPAECGVAVLEMILQSFDVPATRDMIRRVLPRADRGLSSRDIAAAAVYLGLECDAFEVDADEIAAVPVPAILHWRRGHFVVLDACMPGAVSIVDPSLGRRVLDSAQLRSEFSGVVLAFDRATPAAHPRVVQDPRYQWWGPIRGSVALMAVT